VFAPRYPLRFSNFSSTSKSVYQLHFVPAEFHPLGFLMRRLLVLKTVRQHVQAKRRKSKTEAKEANQKMLSVPKAR